MPTFYNHGSSGEPVTVEAYDGGLIFKAGMDAQAHICGIPAAVAEATADAFNEAMRKHEAATY